MGDDWYTNFELPQTVQIRSKWLRIPELLLLFIFISAFILYNFLYMLGFLTVVDTFEEVWIGGARRCTGSCLESRYDCAYVEPKVDRVSEYGYCASGDENESSGKLPCSTFSQYPPTEFLINTDSTSKLTIGTSVVYQNQSKVYVTGAEHTMTMKVLVLVSDLSGSGRMDLTDTEGYVHFLGESTPRRLNTNFSDGPGNDGDTLCGGNYFYDPDLKSSICTLHPPLGVYMSLSVLMEAANMNMSDFREQGGSIDLHIDFTNMEGFWTWPVGFKPKYTISPRRTAYDKNDFSPIEFYWRQVDVDKELTNVIVRGIRINVYVSSVVGEFLVFSAISKLTLASVVLSLVKMIVSNVLTVIYKRIDSMQHVALLYDVTRSEVSRDDHEIKAILEKTTDEGGRIRRSLLFAVDVTHKAKTNEA